VVEVVNGESQEEAWRRYLTHHPESIGVRIKIFHYPNPSHDQTCEQPPQVRKAR
jgi:hypothetical protein